MFASPIERSLSLAHFAGPPPIDVNSSAPLSMHQRTSAPVRDGGVTNWTRAVNGKFGGELLTKLR